MAFASANPSVAVAFKRTLRRHIRAAGAYHSDAGILAVIAQEADQRYAGHSPLAQP